MPSRRGHFLLLAQKKVTKEKGRLVAYPLHSTAKNPIQSAALPNQVAEAAP